MPTPKSGRSVRPDPDALTPKEQAFVDHYLLTLNATKAMIAAGYSAKTANVTSAQLLAKPRVRAAVDKAIAARRARLQMTADNVLLAIARTALGDPRRLFTEAGDLRHITELDDADAALIASFEIGHTSSLRGRRGPHKTRKTVVKVKLWDKMKALELACRHLGIGKDTGEADRPNVPVYALPIETPGVRTH